MSDGTGIVHIAPAFGEDDSRVGREYDLPFVQFVDGKGDLTAETPYAGVFVKKADPMVLADLEKEGKLFDAPKFEHDYPHCWRCDTPLIYYARESWFIKMTAVKDDLIRNNNTINWIPESIGKGRRPPAARHTKTAATAPNPATPHWPRWTAPAWHRTLQGIDSCICQPTQILYSTHILEA